MKLSRKPTKYQAGIGKKHPATVKGSKSGRLGATLNLISTAGGDLLDLDSNVWDRLTIDFTVLGTAVRKPRAFDIQDRAGDARACRKKSGYAGLLQPRIASPVRFASRIVVPPHPALTPPRPVGWARAHHVGQIP